MKKWGLALLMVLALAVPSSAQITVSSFTTSVTVNGLNGALSTIGGQALNRSGGTITGNIAVNSGVTVDGVDISAALGGSGTPTFSTLTLSSTGASALDVAGGINAGSGNVGIVDTTGKIPAISSTYFSSLSGANITGIPADTGLTTTWTTPSYSAGAYTTNGAGGWTVDSGDVQVYKYTQIGKTMYVSVALLGTTVTAATGTQLRVAIPNSKVAAATFANPVMALNNGVATTSAFWLVNGGDTYITVYNEATAATAWTAAANTTQLRFTAVFEVQ